MNDASNAAGRPQADLLLNDTLVLPEDGPSRRRHGGIQIAASVEFGPDRSDQMTAAQERPYDTTLTGSELRQNAQFADQLGRIAAPNRSEEHTYELQSLMRISYAVFCLKKKTKTPP